MTFIAKVNDAGSFIAKVNESASFDVTLVTQGEFNATMGVIGPEGPSGLLSVEPPLIYDSVLKNLSIDLTAYATESWVDANYYSVTNPDGYITSAALAPYITAASAAATYYPLTNPAGYITSSALSGYATESWVTGQGYETAAHAASTYYPLTNPSGYITSSALSPYLLSSTAALTYQPIGDYATNTALTSGLALKLDKPAVAGLADQILSTNGTSNVWIDNQARTLFATVRNETGAPLTKGTIVYISGAAGNKPLVSKALATGDPTSAGTFAILSADISNNNNGTAIVAGELKGIDTFGIPEGTSLWLSPTVAGTWTTTKPTAPNHAVFIGTVVREHQNQGVIEVRIQNGYELEELHDVAVLDKANNDVLVYESSTTLWKSKTIAEVLGYTPADSAALSNYYLASNPAGYITSAALGGYATQSWVTSQGYITSAALSPYLLSSTAASTYQTISGMSSYATLAGANSFTGANTFTISSGSGVPLTVTNTGSGNSFVVNDQTTPDTTPFIINSTGAVMVATTSALAKLTVAELGIYTTSNNSSYPPLKAVLAGTSGSGILIQNDSTNGDSFVIRNGTSNVKVTVNQQGYLGIGTTPSYLLDVNGTANVSTLRFSDGSLMTTAPSATTASQVASFFGASQTGTYATVNTPSTNNVLFFNGTYMEWGSTPNPFNQSLNTFDSPYFTNVSVDDPFNYGNGFSVFGQVGSGSGNSYSTKLTYSGIQNIDGYGITLFSLTKDGLSFYPPSTTGAQYSPTGITFPDGTIQTTAASGSGTTAYDVAMLFGAATQSGSYVTYNPPLANQYLYYDGTYLNWGAAPNPFNQTLDTSSSVNFYWVGITNGLSSVNITSSGITFPDTSFQSKAYPFNGAAALAIENGLINASAPSTTNPFSTEGYVDSAVAAYAAYVDPLLPTQNEKDALVASSSPSSSNRIITNSDMVSYVSANATPSASTSTQGKIQIATLSDVLAGTDQTKSITSKDALWAGMSPAFKRVLSNFGFASSGTGATSTNVFEWGTSFTAPNAGSAGYALRSSNSGTGTPISRGVGQSQIRWDKPIIITGLFNVTSTMDANHIFRLLIGRSPTGYTVGNLTARGFGFSFSGGGTLYLDVHDGTTFRQVSTGITISASSGVSRDFMLYSDGSGNVTLYIDDVAVATSPNGPTGSGTFYNNGFFAEIHAPSTSTTVGNGRVALGGTSLYFGR